MSKKLQFLLNQKNGSQLTETCELPPDPTLPLLKQIVMEKFNLPIEKQLLKIERDGFVIRISEEFPMDFYDLKGVAEIIVESIEAVKEFNESDCLSPSLNGSRPSRDFKSFTKRDPAKENIDKLIDMTAGGNLKEIKEFLHDKEKKTELLNDLGSDGWNATHVAVLKENEEVILYFLEKKADFNIGSTSGWTPLILAIFQNNIEIVKLILSLAPINVNLVTLKGTALNVALKKACKENQKQLVKILMNADANPYLRDEEGNNAFDVCEDPELASLLQINRYTSDIILEKVQPNYTAPICQGFLYKIRNLIVSGGNERFFVLDPDKGQLVRYKTRQDYPASPKEILQLKSIKYLQRIKPTWYMRKDLHYFEIVYEGKQVIGCKYVSTLKIWMTSICNTTYYFNEQDKRRKKLELTSSLIEKQQSPHPVMEIQDIFRDEDKTSNFFRKNKMFPNQDVSNSFLGRIRGHEQSMNVPKEFTMSMPKEFMRSPSNNYDDNKIGSFEGTASPKTFSPELQRSNTIEETKDARVKFDSFEIIKLLGSGSFGRVFLVRKKGGSELFAMKVLKKRDLIIKKKLRYAITETKILKSCNHPFILQIHYSFQTPRNFYLVVDYCPRGDLSSELLKISQFGEDVARFYIAELVLAIEYLHKKNIIYRDLKPENILIDVYGHMKLADFGLSKDGIGDHDRTKSFCGSPAYLSPEVLMCKNKNSKGYGKEADLYGIGAVLYEFIVGAPPYFSPEIPELFKKIKEGKLEFPKGVSPEAKDLIKRLLEQNPESRIGSKSKDEIKTHPFFKNMDWDKLYRREYDPPMDEYELTEAMLKPDKSLNFEDVDYEEKNIDHNRVPDYSFAKVTVD